MNYFSLQLHAMVLSTMFSHDFVVSCFTIPDEMTNAIAFLDLLPAASPFNCPAAVQAAPPLPGVEEEIVAAAAKRKLFQSPVGRERKNSWN